MAQPENNFATDSTQITNKVRVVLSGNIGEGFDIEQVTTLLANIFKCDHQKAKRLVSGKPTKLKKQMDRDTAKRFCQKLTAIGVICSIEPLNANFGDQAATSSASAAPSLSLVTEETEPSNQDEPKITQQQPALNQLSLEPAGDEPAVSHNTTTAQTSLDDIEPGMMACPKCATKQPKSAECSSCGIFVDKYVAQEKPQPTNTNLQTEDEYAVTDEMWQFIGTNIDRYRHKFAEIHNNDHKYTLQWHWPAFLIPVPWMIYRKMYVYAWIFFVIQFLTPFLWMKLLASVTSGLLGNYLYYRHVNASLDKIEEVGDARISKIRSRGDVVPIILTIAITVGMGMIGGIATYFLFFKDSVDLINQGTLKSIQEMEAAKDNPTQLKMITLKTSIVLAKQFSTMANQPFNVPQNMEELKTVMKPPPNAVQDEWGSEMEFAVVGSDITFYSAGPDKTWNTTDDIALDASLE